MRLFLRHSLFASFLFFGCSTSYYVPRDPGADDFVEATGRIDGSSAVAYSIEGNEYDIERLTLKSDSLVGYDRESKALIALPISSVDEIVLTSILRGIGRGALRGLEIGGSIGLFLGIPGAIENKDAGYVGAGAVSGAMLGAATGAIAGFFALPNEHYRILSRDDARVAKKAKHSDVSSSDLVTLKSWPVLEETPDSLFIKWDRQSLRLPKSHIKFERLAGGLINLTVSKSLLESSNEK